MRVILTNSLLKYYLLIKRRITNKLARNNKYKEINKVAKGTVLMREEKVKIIPLGGLGEIGKNITVFECDDEIIVVDCGIAFPDEEMYGVDLIIPDISYLKNNVKKIKGIFLTHGHEDHIGSLPYVLKEVNVPIYGTKLTIGIGLVTAQTSRVTGLVTSEEDGQPVVGASILVNGTTLGTITDIDGKFTITNVPSSAKTY